MASSEVTSVKVVQFAGWPDVMINRHPVRPGITSLNQIDVGYVETNHDVVQKALADIHYIQNAGFWMDTKIAIKTVMIILGCRGS